jgi:acetylglutamate kinase
MDVVQMVLAGKIGKDLAALVHSHGGKAVSLCGVDGAMITAKKLQEAADYGLVGEIIHVDSALVDVALENGYIPIISTVAAGDGGSSVYNWARKN